MGIKKRRDTLDSADHKMTGWDNPLPMGQRAWGTSRTMEECLGGQRKKVWPTSRQALDHSSSMVGP